MDRVPGEVRVAVVRARDRNRAAAAVRDSRRLGSRAAADAKAGPDLGRAPAFDLDGAVRRGGALVLTLGAIAVARGAAVDDDLARAERELERERVGVGVAGHVVGADRRDVEERRRAVALDAHVARLGKDEHATLAN